MEIGISQGWIHRGLLRSQIVCLRKLVSKVIIDQIFGYFLTILVMCVFIKPHYPFFDTLESYGLWVASLWRLHHICVVQLLSDA